MDGVNMSTGLLKTQIGTSVMGMAMGQQTASASQLVDMMGDAKIVQHKAQPYLGANVDILV